MGEGAVLDWVDRDKLPEIIHTVSQQEYMAHQSVHWR